MSSLSIASSTGFNHQPIGVSVASRGTIRNENEIMHLEMFNSEEYDHNNVQEVFMPSRLREGELY